MPHQRRQSTSRARRPHEHKGAAHPLRTFILLAVIGLGGIWIGAHFKELSANYLSPFFNSAHVPPRHEPNAGQRRAAPGAEGSHTATVSPLPAPKAGPDDAQATKAHEGRSNSTDEKTGVRPELYMGRNMSLAIFPAHDGHKATFWLGLNFDKKRDGISCEGGLGNADGATPNSVRQYDRRIILTQPLGASGKNACQITLIRSGNAILASREKSLHSAHERFSSSFAQMEESCAGQHGASCTFDLSGSGAHPLMRRAPLNAANLKNLASVFGSGELERLAQEAKQ